MTIVVGVAFLMLAAFCAYITLQAPGHLVVPALLYTVFCLSVGLYAVFWA